MWHCSLVYVLALFLILESAWSWKLLLRFSYSQRHQLSNPLIPSHSFQETENKGFISKTKPLVCQFSTVVAYSASWNSMRYFNVKGSRITTFGSHHDFPRRTLVLKIYADCNLITTSNFNTFLALLWRPACTPIRMCISIEKASRWVSFLSPPSEKYPQRYILLQLFSAK